MRVVILAYDFPPLVSVGGLRPYSWYRYLKQFGAEPIVVTRQWSNEFGDERDYVSASRSPDIELEETPEGTILRAPYRPTLSNRLLLRYGPTRFRLPRRAITAWYELGQYYAVRGPRYQLYLAARDYLRQHGADVLVATGEPFVLFRYASQLSQEFGIPWIADYRDPWAQNRRRASHWLAKIWNEHQETRFTATASAMLTVSEFVRNLIAGAEPDRPVFVLPNGFDPEAVAQASLVEQGRDRFTIAFVGSIYGWHPVESFFEICTDFVTSHAEPRFRIQFIGINGQEAVETMLRENYPALAPHVTFHGRMPNEEAMVCLARANAFLMFNNYSYVGTKIYDYLALNRRILLCYADDPQAQQLKDEHYNVDDTGSGNQRVLEDVIIETNSGTVVNDARHLREVLEAMYREFTLSGQIACDSRGIERYSRKRHAEQLATILGQVVEANGAAQRAADP